MTPKVILCIHRKVTARTLKGTKQEGKFLNDGDDLRVENEENGEVLHTPPPGAALEGMIAHD